MAFDERMAEERQSPFPPPNSIDPLLQRRLAALQQRSIATPVAPTDAAAKVAATRSGKRRKPAKGSKVAAFALSVATTGALTAMFARADAAQNESAAGIDAGIGATASTTATTAAPATTAATTPGTTESSGTTATTAAPVTTAASSTVADGTYAGATISTKFGPVQVQIVYSGGQITDVTALQTPSDDRKSININNRAVPTLVTETLTAQSASVNSVSGATYTSNAYKQSLQSAIDAALAAA